MVGALFSMPVANMNDGISGTGTIPLPFVIE
jgi:hypothetical protein